MAQATVAIRNAVKEELQKCEAGDCILVAVSGGADSLALAYATLLESAPLALNVVAVTIDHQLQNQSAEQAETVEKQLRKMGYQDVVVSKVNVSLESGVEAGARAARYEALQRIAAEKKATKVFLGHTRDDQAETVLLGLARGSGTRSLSGMASENGIYVRPLLSITRQQTVEACDEVGITYWSDPHNENRDFTRVRVRHDLLPLMEEKIGPGIAAALARSAALLRDDADALDEMAAQIISRLNLADLDCSELEALPGVYSIALSSR